ncbi:MAG: Ig-like domain-containing protein, partial [Verrucomicrobiales bacterium]|nr:Ig-like domain-containing protein [Verrucomicrobiales bacterium]
GPKQVPAAAGGTVIFSGIISGTAGPALEKIGPGTVIFSGPNTYTVGTVVKEGTLLVNNTGASSGTGTGAVTVNSGATLGGTGKIDGAVTVNGTLAPGGATAPGTLTVTNTVALNGTVRMRLKTDATPTNDKLVRTGGALTFGGVLTVTNVGPALVGGEVFDLFDATGFSGSFSATNLPPLGPGMNWWTGNLGVDGSIRVNRAPVAKSVTFSCTLGESVSFSILTGKHATTDADGDAVSVTGVSTPTSGSASHTSSTVTYVASGSAGTHNFTYTVSDGYGGTDTKTVTVIVSAVGNGPNIVPGSLQVSGNNVKLDAYGVPGRTYRLEFTEDLTPPVTWTPLYGSEVVAAANGFLSFDYTHTNALPPTGFFRTKYVSGP